MKNERGREGEREIEKERERCEKRKLCPFTTFPSFLFPFELNQDGAIPWPCSLFCLLFWISSPVRSQQRFASHLVSLSRPPLKPLNNRPAVPRTTSLPSRRRTTRPTSTRGTSPTWRTKTTTLPTTTTAMTTTPPRERLLPETRRERT